MRYELRTCDILNTHLDLEHDLDLDLEGDLERDLWYSLSSSMLLSSMPGPSPSSVPFSGLGGDLDPRSSGLRDLLLLPDLDLERDLEWDREPDLKTPVTNQRAQFVNVSKLIPRTTVLGLQPRI